MKHLVHRLTLASLAAMALVGLSSVQAAGSALDLQKAQIDLLDRVSLQRGAEAFAAKCQVCHSLKYMRFSRVGADLGWSNEEVVERLSYGSAKSTQMMMQSLDGHEAKKVFGTVPPDLSLFARLKGPDYIYTFLNSFYYEPSNGVADYFDPTSQGQWNNKVLHGTSMPAVLARDARNMTPEDFNQMTLDITNYLTYVAEPIRAKREAMGIYVLLFLFPLLILAYLLKREYWKDIH